jgi:peroxiredoxin
MKYVPLVRTTAIAMFSLLFLAASAWPELVSSVQNFTLKDQNGKSWTLFDHKSAKAVVIFVHGVGCPIVRLNVPEIEALKKKYADKGVEFVMLNANPGDAAEDLKTDAKEFSITMPILMDEKQEVARQMGIERTATVLMYVPAKNWHEAYRGAINNRQGYGVQRQNAIELWLDNALTEILAEKPVAKPKTEAKGCLINFLDEKSEAHTDTAAEESTAQK